MKEGALQIGLEERSPGGGGSCAVMRNVARLGAAFLVAIVPWILASAVLPGANRLAYLLTRLKAYVRPGLFGEGYTADVPDVGAVKTAQIIVFFAVLVLEFFSAYGTGRIWGRYSAASLILLAAAFTAPWLMVSPFFTWLLSARNVPTAAALSILFAAVVTAGFLGARAGLKGVDLGRSVI